MSDPTVQRIGDDLRFTWPDAPLRVDVANMRESSDGFNGELAILQLLAGGKSKQLHWAKTNMASTRSRADLVKALVPRWKDSTVEWWTHVIEQVCKLSVEAFRAGQPAVDLATIEIPDRQQYLAGTLIPRDNTAVLFGDGGAGKSLIALALAVAVSHGINLPYVPVSAATNVMYLDWETNEHEIGRRLRALAKGFAVKVPSVYYRAMRHSLVSEAQSIRNEIADRKIGLVICDSLVAAQGGEERESDSTTRTFNALRTFSPAARLVITHMSKASLAGTEGEARPYGSVFVRNFARSVWYVRQSEARRQGEMRVGLFDTKGNERGKAAPFGWRFIYEEEAGRLKAIGLATMELAEDETFIPMLSLPTRIRSALSAGARTTRELVEETGGRMDTITKALRRMQDVRKVADARGFPGSSGSKWALAYREDRRQ